MTINWHRCWWSHRWIVLPVDDKVFLNCPRCGLVVPIAVLEPTKESVMIPIPKPKQPGDTRQQRMDYLATFVPRALLEGFHEKIMSLAENEAEADRLYEMTLQVFGAALVWAGEQYRGVQ